MSDGQESIQSFPPSVFHPPSWRQLYLNAQREKGVQRITQAVMAAETAIFERWLELSQSAGDCEERKQLHEASDELLRLKSEKLGWPNSLT
jgi:hypothetical protein